MTTELKRAAEEVKCKRCNGVGKIPFPRDKNSMCDPLQAQCPDCGGMGKALRAELQREEPKVEVPFKLPVQQRGDCEGE